MKKLLTLFVMLLVSLFVIAGNVYCAGGQIQWSSAFGRTNKAVPQPYNSVGKIDPFQPIFRNLPIKPTSTVHQTDCVSNPVLERLDMSQLMLSGVVLTEGRPIALFQEANGKGHVITEGVCFGVRGGKVERILNGQVIIREEMQDVTGRIQVKKIALKLKRNDN